MNLDQVTIQKVIDAFTKKNYKLGIGINYMNPFGVRANTGLTNTFDDAVGLIYHDDNDQWAIKVYHATTDPGAYWIANPMNVEGTAIVVPGQYKDSHIVGLHHGQYKALVQNAPIRVYRDKDKDKEYDYDLHTIQNGMFGINVHRAHESHTSVNNDKWSAGCQVIASPVDFKEFMSLIDKHVGMTIYDNKFTYTLFEEKDLA